MSNPYLILEDTGFQLSRVIYFRPAELKNGKVGTAVYIMTDINTGHGYEVVIQMSPKDFSEAMKSVYEKG